MARTLITETLLTADAFVDAAAAFQAADSANGMYLDDKAKSGTLVLYVKNTNGATRTVTILAGDYDGVHAGIRSMLGDVSQVVALTSGENIIRITDTMRFRQSDGNIYVDFSAATGVTVAAFRTDSVTAQS